MQFIEIHHNPKKSFIIPLNFMLIESSESEAIPGYTKGRVYLSFFKKEISAKKINFHGIKDKTFYFSLSGCSQIIDYLEYLSVQHISNDWKIYDSFQKMLVISRHDSHHLSISIGDKGSGYEERIHFTVRTPVFYEIIAHMERTIKEKINEEEELKKTESEHNKKEYFENLEKF